MVCVSKASSVAFASPLIGEAHADMSSAAVGNATLDIMAVSYVVEEMGMTFPIPFTLEMDNDAARIFCLGSAHKTKLKPQQGAHSQRCVANGPSLYPVL